ADRVWDTSVNTAYEPYESVREGARAPERSGENVRESAPERSAENDGNKPQAKVELRKVEAAPVSEPPKPAKAERAKKESKPKKKKKSNKPVVTFIIGGKK
ncbi:MAG: hypothetical protein NC223_11280, partial [Butyrivibrio sp.]|nr:hypothetical protein [Butyrivibrio sp.]